MVPALVSLPSLPLPEKRMRPLMKSASLMLSVEAAKPATSMIAPWPNAMPDGLMRNTRPFEVSWPRISDGFCPTTRLSTTLAECCWMKRVISSRAIENCAQLMIAPGVLVIVRILPSTEKVTPPAALEAPDGLAKAEGAEAGKAALTATASAFLDANGRAKSPWSRRARERYLPCTNPPDPSANFRRKPTCGCYAPRPPRLRNYITLRSRLKY